MKKVFILYSRYYSYREKRYEIGGIETYVRNLADVVRELGYEPHVVFASEWAVDDQRDDGTFCHSVQGDMNITPKSLLDRALKLGDAERDIFLFGTSSLVREHRFKNSLAIQHGVYWDGTDFKGRQLTGSTALLARVAQGKRQLNFHSLVSQMVCVDLNYVNWMRSLSVANRLPYRYIPNFADTSAPVPERPDDGKVRVVFARRFETIRGCGLLMEVIPRVLDEHPEVELTIAGDGSMGEELHRLFDGTSRVSFTRYDAAESIQFHGRFDIALVPSVASEGTSLSLLEAMAAGCAVVATDVGGMSNVILNGHNGVLVRPEVAELYRGLTSLIEDMASRKRLARNARQTVEDSFSRDRWARSWAEVFEQFI